MDNLKETIRPGKKIAKRFRKQVSKEIEDIEAQIDELMKPMQLL